MDILQCQVISLRTDGDVPDAFKAGSLINLIKPPAPLV
jgi:hypothetical protein